MQSDPDAVYDEVIELDCTQLSPSVAAPGDPGNGMPIHQLTRPVKVDIAYGGSCTAGKREDFDHYHEMLAWGLAQGRTVAPGVQLFLQYGTAAVRDYCISRGYGASSGLPAPECSSPLAAPVPTAGRALPPRKAR